MFQMKDEMQTAVKHNIRGGDGSPSFRYLFSAEQLGNRAEMMAVITLRPGESVGVHPHETNGEAYYILEGAGDRHRGRREPRGCTSATRSSVPTATPIPSATTPVPSRASWP